MHKDANLISIDQFNQMLRKKKSKYNAKITEYNGKKYQSDLEARRSQHWDTMLSLKLIRSCEKQVRIPLHVNGKKIGDYIADFKITHNDGKEEYEDAKGYVTKMFLWKMRHVSAEYPDLNLFVVLGVRNEQVQKKFRGMVGVRELS